MEGVNRNRSSTKRNSDKMTFFVCERNVVGRAISGGVVVELGMVMSLTTASHLAILIDEANPPVRTITMTKPAIGTPPHAPMPRNDPLVGLAFPARNPIFEKKPVTSPLVILDARSSKVHFAMDPRGRSIPVEIADDDDDELRVVTDSK